MTLFKASQPGLSTQNIDLSAQTVDMSTEPQGFKLNSDKSAVVSTEVLWLPMQSAPRGTKLQLHTTHGTAVYGVLNGSNVQFYNAWAPCPKRPEWLKSLMSPYKVASQ